MLFAENVMALSETGPVQYISVSPVNTDGLVLSRMNIGGHTSNYAHERSQGPLLLTWFNINPSMDK